MNILTFLKDFLKKYNLKNNTMNETELKSVYNYPIYPKNSKIYSERGFVNIAMVEWEGLIGLVSYLKIINHTTSTHLEVSQINFYLINYLNQYYIIIIKFNI